MPLRVLVVDDSPAVAHQLEEILERLRRDAQVTVAVDLAAARRALAADRPDVVFLDIVLADGENGLAFLWDVGRASRAVGVVTMSGLPRAHPHVEAAAAVGVRHHLEKPLRAEGVAAALEAVGAGQRS